MRFTARDLKAAGVPVPANQPFLAGNALDSFTVELPWPPTVNMYWRRVGERTLISKEGRAYRKTVCDIRLPGHIAGKVAVAIVAHPPDNRNRDLDNLFKAVLDSLCHAGAYTDDSQICDLHILLGSVVPGGKLRVYLGEYEEFKARKLQ